MIPDGWLLGSNNWLSRRGSGSPRPGYVQVGSQVAAANRITGLAFRGTPAENNLVIHTITAAYWWDGTALNTITGTWTSSSADQPVRMTTFRSGGTTWLARVNAVNAVDKWDGSVTAFQNIAAAVAGVDLAVVGNRLVVAGVTDTRSIRWSGFNDIDTWSSLDEIFMVDTPGEIVAIRALGPLSAAVYKTDSIYVISVQAAQTAFQSQFIGHVQGPVSPTEVVSIAGAHYWFARDNAIYSFDGSRIRPVTSAIGKTLFQNFSVGNRLRAHGTPLAFESNEAWFWYPGIGYNGAVRQGFSFNTSTGAVNPHVFPVEISASELWTFKEALTIDDLTGTIDGLSNTYSQIDAMQSSSSSTLVLGDSTGKFYRFGQANDDAGTAIPWNYETGWRAPAGIDGVFQVDGVVSYWKTAEVPSLTVTVEVKTSDSLSEAETASSGTFDVTTDSNHLLNFSGRGKWVRVKHSASSTNVAHEHRGAAIIGWNRGMT
jgi:hypothetical protein